MVSLLVCVIIGLFQEALNSLLTVKVRDSVILQITKRCLVWEHYLQEKWMRKD